MAQRLNREQRRVRREILAPPNAQRWGAWMVGKTKLQMAPPADAPLPRPERQDADLSELEFKMSQLLDEQRLQYIGHAVLDAEPALQT